ncbi:ImmA/IrrE family metallo-endopeptidase [Candidatus Palauibacter sp.]|uniref:ImmA/IrrE family metallo-endopeptidase n=1 Tax=Candidatus Palauibacter sp. TaxID=3101350 RepID=UPI003B5BAD86
MARRKDILNAVYEAERLHKEFDSRARADAGEGRIDVFAMLVERDIPVMFQPLKNLLGAFVDTPDEGIMVTSQRPLPVQRFTAAHELGHSTLGHEASFDGEEVLTRALFSGEGLYDRREIQANAFATQLLTPSWLLAHHMRRQGWTRDNLTDPVVVYQLSL